MWKNGLIRKIRLVSKFMALQPGEQTIAKHILSNISRRKYNQAMIFGQLMVVTWEIIFLKNHTQNAIDTLFPDPSLKNVISLDRYYTACFYCMPSWGLSEHIETKLQNTVFTSYKAFLKNKTSRTSLPALLSVWFLKWNISLVIFHYLSKFHSLVAFTSWDIAQYV